MVGFPYNYGDDLTSLEAEQNRQLFFKKYGSLIIINGVLFAITKHANAKELIPDVPKNVEAPKPAPSPVFRPILPPSALVNSKAWGVSGIGVIGWLCVTAAVTQNPALLVACGSMITYATAK